MTLPASPISDAALDSELGRALRALPGTAARAEFRAEVMARAERAAALRTLRRRRGLSLAAGVCVFAVGLGVWSYEVAAERAARHAALVDEHRRLAGELEELRELSLRRSRISLGGDASTDLYLDLTKIPDGAAAGRSSLTTRSPG